MTETHNADGTTDTTGFARYGDVGIAVTTKKDADGNVVGTPTRSLLLEGVDDSYVKGIYELTGKTPPSDPGRDLRLDFTEAQLEQLRQPALSRWPDQIELNRDGRPTNEEISSRCARTTASSSSRASNTPSPASTRCSARPHARGGADRALPRRHELRRGGREPRAAAARRPRPPDDIVNEPSC